MLVFGQLLAIAWFSPGAGLPLDDAWIHQVVARTFAETGTLGYAPGQHGAAATSYLWAGLLAFNLKVLHLEPSRWALVLNGAAALATGQLLFTLTERARPDPVPPSTWRLTACAATLFACISPNVLWFTTSGMEAMPFAALSLTAIVASALDRPLLAGFAAGALALLRPEAAPLGALLVLDTFRRTKSVRACALRAAPWLTAVAIYAGSNLAKTGHALPSTLAGRRWLWFEATAGLGRTDRVLDFLDAWNQRLGTYTLDTSPSILWALLALAAYGALRLIIGQRGERGAAAPVPVRQAQLAEPRGMGRSPIAMLFGWALFHAAFYALLLPTPGHGGRYQPLTPLLFALCLPLGTMFLLGELARIFRLEKIGFGWLSVVGLVPWVALALPVATSLRKANALAVAHIDTTERGVGLHAKTLGPGNIAAFDIGGIGWTSERRILDLGGLSDPNVAALLEAGRASTWLEQNDVQWLVLPESYENVLPDFGDYAWRLHLRENAAIQLEPLRVFETPFERWVPAIKATWNAAPRQVLFRVHYTKKPGPRVVPVPDGTATRVLQDPAGLLPRRDRAIAEHMLAVLDTWGYALDLHALPGPPPPGFTSEHCAVALGGWGFAVAGCADAPALKTTLFEQAGRYIDVGDLGGAVRAIPHLVAGAKRRIEPSFHPPLAPLDAPIAGGAEDPGSRAGRYGLALFALVLAAILGIDRAARRGVQLPRRGTAATVALLLLGCGKDDDVARAIPRGRGAVVQALANGGSPSGSGGRAPLIGAAHAGDAEILALLLERGADPAVKDANGVNALHITTRNGNPAGAAVLLGALVRHGRSVDETAGPRVRTALQDACAGGNLELVRLLLAAKADANARDWFGQTPLHIIAAVEGVRAARIGQLLLDHDADAAVTDARGFTPLHAAAMADNFELARVLAREPVRRRTPADETALDVALRYRRDRTAEVLLQAGAPIEREGVLPPLHEAAKMDAVERIAALLAIGADVARRFDGKTAFEIAKQYESRRAMTLLREPTR